jgi:NAD(P)-dependent dehydrogenase (short-subunit alcohol dehydrogenase family)
VTERTSLAERTDLTGRSILVTGASPGSLGFATAQSLADWGARVVITTRSEVDKAVAAMSRGERDVVGHELDLVDAGSVARFATWYHETRGETLDVLVNNAGIHLDLRSTWKQPRLTADGHELHWRTNYLGTMHLTHLLLPALREAGRRTGDARIVNVVSKLHTRGRNEHLFTPLVPYNSWDAYGLSKLALVHATYEIARRCAADNVRAYAVHPGSVYSHIADRGLEEHRVLSALRRVFAPIESRMLLTPEQGAQTTLHCATARDLRSGYYRACAPAEPSDQSQDRAAAARLWDETQAWVAALVS